MPDALPDPTWDPAQYERFKAQRAQPFHDLLAEVQPRPDLEFVDLGCGTGELTRHLHRELGARNGLGLDRSTEMLERSQPFAGEGLRFEQAPIESFAAEAAFDLVFSNAALHWVEDHRALLARLVRALRPGGQLAVQVPANHDHPAHRTAAELAGEAPYAQGLDGYVGHRNVLPPEDYASILWDLGLREQAVRVQVYGHELPGAASVFEWMKGSTLTGFSRRLSPELYAAFEATYRERLLARLGEARPFFYTFKRILMWGRKDP